MQRHPYFNLWLHTDAELAGLLSDSLVERVTLHEWPLSCVQKLTLANGARWIYKVQTTEGVEVDFYRRVRSPLLPAHRYLETYQNTAAICLEWIDAPGLNHLSLDEVQIIQHGKDLTATIREIPGDAPVYADLGSVGRWQKFVDETLSKLTRLVESGQFPRVDPACAAQLADWARSPRVMAAVCADPGLAHADLTGENVFVTPAGYKLIDWQYPRILPAGFDLACFLDNMGVDPYREVDPAVVNMVWFVRLAWFVECKARLFPAGETYDRSVNDLAQRIFSHPEGLKQSSGPF